MTQPDPMDVASCTCANLRRVTRVVTQAYDGALRPLGLRATQFSLLAALATLGTVAMVPLAEALGMDRTTLTRNLKPLIAKGLVRLESDSDQRVRLVALTAEGAALYQQGLPKWREAQSRLVEGLGERRWARLIGDIGAAAGVAREA